MKNMKRMKRVAKTVGTLGLVGCAVMSSPSAMADAPFWYLGGNIGQSRAKIDDARITAQLPGSVSISDDNSNTAFKLFGGYQFNKNFALEAGYFNLGKFELYGDHVTGGNTERKDQAPGLESGRSRHNASW